MPHLPKTRTKRAPIRVVHVVISLAVGGLETVVVNLAKRAGQGFHPHVICLETTGDLAQKLADAGVPVECLGDPTTPVMTSVLRLRKRIAELVPDVVHAHNEKAHIHSALATLGWNRPALIYTRHGRTQVSTLPARIAHRLALRRTRFVVCVSADSSGVSRAEGADPERMRVIRNGIDVRSFEVSSCGRESSRPGRAVTVARMAPVKDIGTMLRAVGIVREARPDFTLHIVGDGPSRPELESLSHGLGLQGVVTFHGVSSDPRPFLSGADIFVQSSTSEGLSLTLVEAMASGLPVVATDVGGNREVVDPGHTGLLVPPRNPAALAEAMLRVLGSAPMALAMSRSARARAEKMFDLAPMVADYETLYVEASSACSG